MKKETGSSIIISSYVCSSIWRMWFQKADSSDTAARRLQRIHQKRTIRKPQMK